MHILLYLSVACKHDCVDQVLIFLLNLVITTYSNKYQKNRKQKQQEENMCHDLYTNKHIVGSDWGFGASDYLQIQATTKHTQSIILHCYLLTYFVNYQVITYKCPNTENAFDNWIFSDLNNIKWVVSRDINRWKRERQTPYWRIQHFWFGMSTENGMDPCDGTIWIKT